jgi:catechol 2,3-dioxygenase-like lactoylglutathione lyase family enzyme
VPELEGVHHVALTVTDLAASRAWYERLFDAQVMWEEKEDGHEFVALFVPPFVIGLHTHAKTTPGDYFAEARVGLDHVSFGVPDRAGLDAWAARLDELGIAHSPITDAPYGTVLVFRDPDNIPLEFYALPG